MRSIYAHRFPMHIAVLDCCECHIPYTKGTLIPRINVPNQRDNNGEYLYRGRGIGTKLLKECIADADKEDVTLYIDVSPSDGLNKKQLTDWYMRHGFTDHFLHKGLLERTPVQLPHDTNYYILHQYTNYPISESSVRITEDTNPRRLQMSTLGKGHKFFINHSTGGTRFIKNVDGRWIKMNGQA